MLNVLGENMEYQSIVNEISRMYNEEFNMDSFKTCGSLNKRINMIAINDDFRDVKKEYDYYAIKNYLEDMVFHKLKEKLGYEDEIIKKIISYLSFAEVIDEIFVIDGNVLVKVLSKTTSDPEYKVYFIPEKGFYDITSVNFSNTENYGMIKELVVNSINNIFKSNIDINKALDLNNNGSIKYRELGLNIFINKPLSELGKINDELNNDVIKVIVKYKFDKIYTFDMKLRDGYLVIYQNEYNVNKVSEALNTSSKKKTR